MVLGCVVVDCHNGHGSVKKLPEGVSVHKLPSEEKFPERRKLWIKNIGRKDWKPTKNSAVCSLHFKPNSFKTDSMDTNKTGQKRRSDGEAAAADGSRPVKRPRRLLKAGAVPTEFPSSYKDKHLQPAPVIDRSAAAHADARWIVQQKEQEGKIEQFLAADKVHSLGDITQKFKKESAIVPSGFVHCSHEDKLLVLLVDFPASAAPKLRASVTINTELTYSVAVDGEIVPATKYDKDKTGTIGHFTKLTNVMCQAYHALRSSEIITLPSTRTLDKIVRNLTVETGPSERDYLRMRLAKEKPEENPEVLYCTIIIDEIHTARKVQYSSAQGAITGQTEDGQLAKTMLVFMVQSLRSKYREVVGLYPMNGLTADKQHTAFLQVLRLVCDVGLKPIAIITDNLRTNFSFMKKLGRGELRSHVKNPVRNEADRMFLLFDYVHNFKNIYNSFSKPRLSFFDMPPMPNSGLQTAKFSDIRELYEHEFGKPLKMAHRLLKRALAPNNLERPNVSLAASVFSESTRDALAWYCKHEGKQWQGTRDFVALIVRHWDILNVRTLQKGKHKRNEYQEPLSDPNGKQIQFLKEFCDFLKKWQESEKVGLNGGLTLDTFRAVRHTCKTMIKLARYCLLDLGWVLVLLGKCSSDPLEGHFSAYRQTQGGNFLIGVKQILESEKKLRAIAALSYSGCDLDDLKNLKEIDSTRSATALAIAKDLSPRISALLSETPTKSDNTDLNIIFYVCGAMVRSHMICTNSCGPCERLLLNNGKHQQMPTLSTEEKVAPNVAEFVEQVNRGGLLVPSSLAFGLGKKSWEVFECIKEDEGLRADFLKVTNHRAVFVETMLNLLEEESEIDDVLVNDLTCANGHQFGRALITKCFQCMLKNWIREMSTAVPPGSERKVAKLTSKPAK